MARCFDIVTAALLCAGAALASPGAVAQTAADTRLAVANETLACSAYADALPQLKAAAEAGSAEAQELLGWLYYEGTRVDGGVPRDLAEARRWLRLAAESGRARAQEVYTALELDAQPATRFATR
ncbi:MAG: SEL1-like repeat protein [Burkholderiales bacterium]|nr:SEL1-like repeat protein [Burkholderiales bacterium]